MWRKATAKQHEDDEGGDSDENSGMSDWEGSDDKEEEDFSRVKLCNMNGLIRGDLERLPMSRILEGTKEAKLERPANGSFVYLTNGKLNETDQFFLTRGILRWSHLGPISLTARESEFTLLFFLVLLSSETSEQYFVVVAWCMPRLSLDAARVQCVVGGGRRVVLDGGLTGGCVVGGGRRGGGIGAWMGGWVSRFINSKPGGVCDCLAPECNHPR